ncbi:bifunctional glutamate--cysteine ligase GshA/glutathione synthetase GshB [Rubritalea sp.]|uniref:bifunctional glutamate--cysteine ligase GshA/glutathione synthetase GshB n=1 Tax=Rubritalea sp. TaxID=2109375 RepID=UPI003EF992B9
MSFRDALTAPSSQVWFLQGKFGIEKEHVRVDSEGKLALTPHPAAFGDKLANPYVTVDFSESQLEMITPPVDSMREALGFIETIHDIVTENLDGEYLWPQSMPPALPENGSQIPLAQFDSEHRALSEYRRFLAQTYGRKKQMISGVHVNLSLSESLLDSLQSEMEFTALSKADFKAKVYMKALRNMMRYRWMMVALLGNSPAADESYKTICPDLPQITPKTCCGQKSVSIRASICGYRNNEDFTLDYQDWSSFHRSVRDLVEAGKLIHEKELYSPIRLKTDLQTGEITHLEIRLLDLDPTTKVGIREESLQLLHLFMLWAIAHEDDTDFDQQQQAIATANQYHCACCGFDSKISASDGSPYENGAKHAVANFLDELTELLPEGEANYAAAIGTFRELLDKPDDSPLEKARLGIRKNGFIHYNLGQAKQFYARRGEQSFRFSGLEDLELSTQLMLREAVRRGVKFDLLDRADNFVRFQKGKHIEYVQQATKTSKDNYATILMMENKLVTKKVLAAAKLNVPLGGYYTDAEQAKADFFRYQNKATVVKPKSTNFGIGISILKDNSKIGQYNQAIDIAFAEDSSVLVEPFVAGREFRFFLIDNEVVGILHRVPANVTGDGSSTITELVRIKNEDPLRGKGYVTPLEKIALGEAELMFLESQELSFTSVPLKNETVYLRENSNISTGGDSLDFTDEVHPSYNEIAVQAAKSLNVAITGLDMMISDITAPATAVNYSIIEMNFNPAIHIHCYPFQGHNRELNKKLMYFLGF